MCQGTTKKGTRCKNPTEPYCRFHTVSLAIKKFNRGPTKADGPGYIYVYSVEGDAPQYYKIGSSVDPIKRVKEWKGKIEKTYYVHFRQLAERMIHLELNHVRVYRYKLKDVAGDFAPQSPPLYCSVWKATGGPVDSIDADIKAKYPLHGFQKHVEWFRTSWETIHATIGVIINLINDKGYRRWSEN